MPRYDVTDLELMPEATAAELLHARIPVGYVDANGIKLGRGVEWSRLGGLVGAGFITIESRDPIDSDRIDGEVQLWINDTTGSGWIHSGDITTDWLHISGITSLSQSDVYLVVKNILQQGSNISVVDNDTSSEITIASQLRNANQTYNLINNLIDYNDLLNKPTIPMLRNAAQTYALLQGLLDYNDLENHPNIPTLRNAAQTYALLQGLLDYGDLQNQPTIPDASTQVNLYPFIRSMLQQGNNVDIDVDDTNHEITINASAGESPTASALYQRAESIKFQARTAVSLAASALSHIATDPIEVDFGSGSADFVETTADATKINFLKSGVYFYNFEATIDEADGERYTPSIKVFAGDADIAADAHISESSTVYVRSFEDVSNFPIVLSGVLIIPSDDYEVIFAISQQGDQSGTTQTFDLDANSQISLFNIGGINAPSEEDVYDLVKSIFVAGDNVTLVKDDDMLRITITGEAGGGVGGTVETDATIAGVGSTADPLRVAIPFTSALRTKLNGIETGAEVNVRTDWNSNSGDSQLVNKPTNQQLYSFISTFLDFNDLQNQPTIPTLRNANQTYNLISSLLDYGDLSNAPNIPSLRNAAQTYALIESLLDYDDLQNQPTIPPVNSQDNLFPFIRSMLQQGNNVDIDVDNASNEITINATGGGNADASTLYQRAESVKFQLRNAISLAPSQLSRAVTDPIEVEYGSGAADFIETTADVGKINFLKAGVYFYSYEATIDGTAGDRYTPSVQVFDGDATIATADPISQSSGQYVRDESDNQPIILSGMLIIPSDEYEVIFAISQLGDQSTTTQTFDLDVNSKLTFYNVGGTGSPTESDVYDLVKSIFVAGDNITLTRDNNMFRITIAGEAGGGGSGTVATDGTISGSGTTADPLTIAIPFTSALRTKLNGIESGAEVNVRTDWDATSGDARLLNKPTNQQLYNLISSFMDYNDLQNQPTIPSLRTAAQTYNLIRGLLDYDHLQNTPNIPTLRSAGETYSLIQSLLDYNDLQNQPTIPSLRNAAQTYALIQGLLDYDDLQNVPDAPGLRTAAETYALIQSLLDYNDLQNQPTIPTLRSAAQTYNLISSLLNYNDLLNQPTIPTLRNGAQTYALIQGLLDYDDLQNVPDSGTAPTQSSLYPHVKPMLQQGANISLTKDDDTSEIIIAASGGDGMVNTAFQRSESVTFQAGGTLTGSITSLLDLLATNPIAVEFGTGQAELITDSGADNFTIAEAGIYIFEWRANINNAADRAFPVLEVYRNAHTPGTDSPVARTDAEYVRYADANYSLSEFGFLIVPTDDFVVKCVATNGINNLGLSYVLNANSKFVLHRVGTRRSISEEEIYDFMVDILQAGGTTMITTDDADNTITIARQAAGDQHYLWIINNTRKAGYCFDEARNRVSSRDIDYSSLSINADGAVCNGETVWIITEDGDAYAYDVMGVRQSALDKTLSVTDVYAACITNQLIYIENFAHDHDLNRKSVYDLPEPAETSRSSVAFESIISFIDTNGEFEVYEYNGIASGIVFDISTFSLTSRGAAAMPDRFYVADQGRAVSLFILAAAYNFQRIAVTADNIPTTGFTRNDSVVSICSTYIPNAQALSFWENISEIDDIILTLNEDVASLGLFLPAVIGGVGGLGADYAISPEVPGIQVGSDGELTGTPTSSIDDSRILSVTKGAESLTAMFNILVSEAVDPVDPVATEGGIYVFNKDTADLYKFNLAGVEQWVNNTLPDGVSYDPIVVTNEGIYIPGGGLFSNLYKINLDGVQQWVNNTLPDEDHDLIIVTDEGIYIFYTDTADIYKFNLDGVQQWVNNTLPDGFYDPIVVTDEAIYLFNENTDDLYKFNLDGVLQWTNTDMPDGAYEPIIVTDEGVYILNQTSQDLYKFNLAGVQQWVNSDMDNGVYDPIIVTDEGIYVFRESNVGSSPNIYKFNLAGVEQWSMFLLSGISNVVVTDDAVYILADNDLYKFNLAGVQQWVNSDMFSGVSYDPIVVTDEAIYIFSDQLEWIYKFNLDGVQQWVNNTLPDGSYDPIVVTDEAIYLFNENTDDIYKISLDGVLQWTNTDLPSGTYDSIVVIPA